MSANGYPAEECIIFTSLIYICTLQVILVHCNCFHTFIKPSYPNRFAFKHFENTLHSLSSYILPYQEHKLSAILIQASQIALIVLFLVCKVFSFYCREKGIPKLACMQTDYKQAALNVMVVGNVVGELVKYVKNDFAPDLSYTTFCIGLSLGAHTCGFVGKSSKMVIDYFTMTILNY